MSLKRNLFTGTCKECKNMQNYISKTENNNFSCSIHLDE